MERSKEMCYVFIPTTKEIGVVKWGESGYYQTGYGTGHSQEEVDYLNERIGVMKPSANAMEMCSMANLPDNDEAWSKHYNMCLEIYKKHEKESDTYEYRK